MLKPKLNLNMRLFFPRGHNKALISFLFNIHGM